MTHVDGAKVACVCTLEGSRLTSYKIDGGVCLVLALDVQACGRNWTCFGHLGFLYGTHEHKQKHYCSEVS